MNKYQTLAANTALISIGTFGSKVLVFLMVRFYTGYLTPAEYGTADLITQTANLLIPLVSLDVTEGVFRFAADRREQRVDAFSVGVYTVIFGAAALIFALPLLRVLAGSRQFGLLLAAFIIAACAHALCAQFIRAEGHTTLYAVQGLFNTALYIAFNVLFLTVFMDAWQLSAIAESGDRRAHLRFYSRVWDAFFSAVYLCAGGIIAFSPLLIRLLAAESYYEAWRYIPVLTLSMIAAAFSNFMGSVYVVTKKSTASLWTSLFGAAANIALNLILIPRIGVQGAAVATFLGCLLVFLVRTVSARQLLPFALSDGKLALGVLALLVQTAAMLLRPHGWLIAQGVCLIVLALLALRPMLAAAQTVFQRK